MQLHSCGLAAGLLAVSAALPATAQELTEAWRTGGFMSPESVSYDAGTGTLFVTNINSPDMSANGEGYVSQLSMEGEVMNEQFVTGLNAPKGTLVADGMLYVAGVEELVAIDIAAGEVAERYSAPGAGFLNDVTQTEDGTIYVTETGQGAIYALQDGELTQVLADPMLAGANGIVADGNMLNVATMGDISGGFENLQPSNVKVVDTADMSVSDYASPEGVGALDGIEMMDGQVMVTDNMGGRLVSIAEDGTVTELASVGGGAADHEYIPEEGMVLIPNLQTGEVVAWQMN
ncbi:SMP-30/gluconolactonase/LRE family protein [Pseudoroseicyclus tamaricis]|uniref:Gluconolaconase n=1 Tax=Pseudoroseicyclus tamaricis TaxID=2705421 RepID=A0A6B2K6F5_9RHOB|nr:gluconolaconase [Pseudoroseicyclus tamaricis]NDV02456.1 gluconolaconase [Pseudoroseicyclus tamaricis]